jgi:hypothetical protein
MKKEDSRIDHEEMLQDIEALKKIRELWDLINYDLNFWVEITKKKALEQQEVEACWSQLGDMLWKLSPQIDATLSRIEEISILLQTNQKREDGKTNLDEFYKGSGKAVMLIALTIKITNILKVITKDNTDAGTINNMVLSLNAPLNSNKFEQPLELIERERKTRKLC